MVDAAVDITDDKAEKTREVADMRIYHFGWNFLQLNSKNTNVAHAQYEFHNIESLHLYWTWLLGIYILFDNLGINFRMYEMIRCK